MKRSFFNIITKGLILIPFSSVMLYFVACTVEGEYTGERIFPPISPQLEPMILTVQGSGEKIISMSGTGEVSLDSS